MGCRQRWSQNDEFAGLPEEDADHCKRWSEEEERKQNPKERNS
jgi:hypothetical protein